MVAVYQWGWLGAVFGVHDPGPMLNFLPIILVGILFGLAMDYQLFLVSGMREAYVHGTRARARRSWRVCATGAPSSPPRRSSWSPCSAGSSSRISAMVRPLGFGLAIGVLLDAFVVRMLLDAGRVMHLLGEEAWWLPKWLDRILPDVDVEGAALERTHPVAGVHQAPRKAPQPRKMRAPATR